MTTAALVVKKSDFSFFSEFEGRVEEAPPSTFSITGYPTKLELAADGSLEGRNRLDSLGQKRHFN
jgi:hypothetical protein